jgi:hypothetical protein
MIWHIFRKDWKLEWRLALGVALVQVILSGILWKQGPTLMANLLALAALLARAFVIVETVHNDPIPGVRQDWLVRPIRRSELLAAKILFTVLVVQAPVFAGDLAEALAEGFSFGASFEAAFSRSLYLLFAFSLPAVAISSITKNLLEVLAAGVGSVLVFVLGNVITQGTGLPTQKLTDTAVGWTAWSGSLVMLLGLVAVVLFMQFRRRMTVVSRWVAATGALVLVGITILPWQPAAFALQSRLSPDAGAGSKIELAFNASPGPVPPGQRAIRINSKTALRIPLSVAGLPDDSIVAADHYEMHLVDSSGTVRAKSRSPEYIAEVITVGREGKGAAASIQFRSPAIYATVIMDTEDYLRLRADRMRVDVEYSLTLLQMDESYAIPAVNGDGRLPGVGWCRTNTNQPGDSIVLNCVQAGRPPDCYSRFLEHTPSGRRSSVEYECSNRDYSPTFAQLFPDSLVRFGQPQMRFHDPAGDVHYAVDAEDIGHAQVVIRNYRTLDHFTRTVTTPERPLSEWLAK